MLLPVIRCSYGRNICYCRVYSGFSNTNSLDYRSRNDCRSGSFTRVTSKIMKIFLYCLESRHGFCAFSRSSIWSLSKQCVSGVHVSVSGDEN